MCMQDETFLQLARRFDAPGVRAIVLLGSHARGDAGPWSDVDLVRLVEAGAVPEGAGSHLIDERLVVVSNVEPAGIDAWFSEPEAAVNALGGLRFGRALIERDGAWAAVVARAAAFRWDAAMQRRAEAWCSAQMVGWIEEAHKGLEGLRRDDVGRLLNARFGLSWGLTRVLSVYHGVLATGDNGFWRELAADIPAHPWVELRAVAFGLDGSALRDQVRAGLRLYVAIAEQLAPTLLPEHAPLVARTAERIRQALDDPAAGANIADFT